MHAAAGDLGDGFGHERRVQAVAAGDVLDDELERLDVVAGFDDVGELEVDLALAGTDLVMARFDGEADFLEFEDDVATAVAGAIDRRKVEIPSLVGEFEDRSPFSLVLNR